jgi:hypothetical protein
MTYLQGIGSLRAFVAGGSKAYHDVMGWTDAVSSSPLSVGAVQCVTRMPYLLQYLVTIGLPLIAAIIVVLIFMLVTTARSIRCRPTPGYDLGGWLDKLRTWWRSHRHWATLLFVLFMAYMPITSASLRALDCYSTPVDGVIYLRLDMSVQCYVGQHAVARVVAFLILAIVGIGFPLTVAWLLGTASKQVLQSESFHNTWGFLFDGYRLPVEPSNNQLGGQKRARTSILGIIASPTPAATACCGRAGCLSSDNLVAWESLVLLRKAGIVSLALLVTNPYLQCVGAVLWMGGFFWLQVRFQPYTTPLFNRLETLSVGASLLTAIISTALLENNAADTESYNMTPVEWSVTLLLAGMNLTTFALLAGTWLVLQCRRARTVVRHAINRQSGTPVTALLPAATIQALSNNAQAADTNNTAPVVKPLRVVHASATEEPVTQGDNLSFGAGELMENPLSRIHNERRSVYARPSIFVGVVNGREAALGQTELLSRMGNGNGGHLNALLPTSTRKPAAYAPRTVPT